MTAKASYKPQLVDDSGGVLFTKYMDNTYLGFCNIPHSISAAVHPFVEVFQDILYSMFPLNGNPRASFYSGAKQWFFNPEMWDRWSPNCAPVLQSMVPALVHKSLTLCNSTQCRNHNMRGIVLGFGYKHYKWEWWYIPLKCRLQALGLDNLCKYHALKGWALEGSHIAESMGRGGCTQTQESSHP